MPVGEEFNQFQWEQREEGANAAIVVTGVLLMGAVATHTITGKAFFLFYE